ncbi:MAG: tRNA (guanine(46)-N(7))-methyltransferase TrmB [Thermosulfidibacteraceae bacterium]|jgi:tRNA G46 methylase TrmB
MELLTPREYMERNLDFLPKVVEIGFGYGEFLSFLAESEAIRVFGVDISNFSFDKARSRLKEKKVSLIKVDGYFFVKYMNAPGTIKKLYILFPDPWPKVPSRRLINDEFVRILASRVSGEVYIATDHDEYAKEIERAFTSSSCFYLLDWSLDVKTKYTRKWSSLGRSFKLFRFVNRGFNGTHYDPALISLEGRFKEVEFVRENNIVLKRMETFYGESSKRIVSYLYAEKNFSFVYYFKIEDDYLTSLNTCGEVLPPFLRVLVGGGK